MSRWIDADEFERCLRNYRPYVDSGRFNAMQTEVNQVLDCIEYEIDDAPTISIVRCGECKYTDFCEKKIHRHGIAYSIDFCSYGEAKESE